jgi:lysozyme family protein|tara:strand:- start:28 stop:597 length:570 start_codon:yes stop_codon:yes gene_type:complete
MIKGLRIMIWISMGVLPLRLGEIKYGGSVKDVTSFDQVIKEVFKHEGGYVNDPDDPGGETKYGISKKAFPDENIKKLTKQHAAKLYYDKYWIPSKVHMLPNDLWAIYFDMAVNMGTRRAATILQKACNHKNKVKIKVDGRMGKNTAKSAKILEPERLRSFRVKYYADLVTRKPVLEKYWFGWYRRALAV